MSYVLGTVVVDFSSEPTIITGSGAASGHEFTLAESEAAGIQPALAKAGFNPWWVLGGIAAVWYLNGAKKFWQSTRNKD